MEKKPSAWILHVESFVSSSKSTEIDAIAKLIKDGVLTLEALVRDMELYLTSTDHFIRGRGVTLLAEVVDRLSSKPLDPTTVHSLVIFFTSKLADWQALHGALVGCLTLLRRKHDAGTVVGSDARALAESYLQYIHVQLLALEDRKLCFETFVCLLDVYREDVAILEKSLINGICEAIDNEKDPSCLMLTFHIVELLGEIFPDPSGPLAAIAEHLFDMLGCYFPIYFTHPKNENFDIKRDDLSVALMHAFCSTPLFEPFAIPLLLDKLSSSLPLAKIDSLRYLNNCILHYGAGRMEKYGKSIWYSLKTIILSSSPLEPSLQMSEQGGISDPQENDVYKEAILCLQTALSQQGVTNRLFISWILEDKEFDICFSSAASEISYASLSVEKRQTLSAVGSILGALAKVSSQYFDQVFCCFFPRLIDTLGISSCDSSFEQKSLKKDVSSRTLTFGALYLSVKLIASCRDFTISSGEFFNGSISGKNKWFHLLQSVYIPLVYALGSLVTGHCSKEENTLTVDCKCAVEGLQILATFPGKLHGLESGYEYILGAFWTIITGMFKYSVIWKMALESLVQIGSFIEHIGCFQRRTIYSSFVVDNMISLLGFHDYKMPLSLKLEAVLSIGAICPAYMYRVIRELEVLIFRNFVEAFVDDNENYASTLVCLLESYSRQVLPWCSTKGNYEEVASHFALCVWKKMENISISDTLYRRDVSEALSLTMKFVVGNSKEEYQLMIINKAYSVIQSRIISPLMKSTSFSHSNLENMQLNLESITLSLNDKLLASLFADVLIALRPQVPIPDIKFMLDLLSVFFLMGHISAAQALGSIVNKWPSGVAEADKMPCTLEEALNIIFNRCMLFVDTKISRKTDGNSAVHIDVIAGLAWIGKGLLMRGHEKSKEIIMVLFKSMMMNCIETVPSISDVGSYDQQEKSFVVLKSAADAFDILTSDSEICLNKKFHATERPLYRQKFFSSILPIFLSSIKESDSSNTRDLLYRAFGHVISNTPQAALLMEAKKLILPLFEGLSVLSADHTNKDLVYSLLLVFSGILMDDDGKNIVIDNAHIIINCLLKLTSYPDVTLIRETAIQCLIAISELPHARIYPMRQQVLRAIMKALDDPKRIVRVEAVRCRRTWESIG